MALLRIRRSSNSCGRDPPERWDCFGHRAPAAMFFGFAKAPKNLSMHSPQFEPGFRAFPGRLLNPSPRRLHRHAHLRLRRGRLISSSRRAYSNLGERHSFGLTPLFLHAGLGKRIRQRGGCLAGRRWSTTSRPSGRASIQIGLRFRCGSGRLAWQACLFSWEPMNAESCPRCGTPERFFGGRRLVVAPS